VGGNGCFRIDCAKEKITDPKHEQRVHEVIYEQKMRDGECTMTVGLARLLHVHSFTLENSGFLDVYAAGTNAWYRTWKDFVESTPRSAYREWQQELGDFWGGILKRYRDAGRWPKIRDLFQTSVEHRFQLVAHGDSALWQRKQILFQDGAGNVDFQQNRRLRWGQRIFEAYSRTNVLTSLEDYAAEFQVIQGLSPAVAAALESGGPPSGGPEPEPAFEPARVPKKRIEDDKWLHDTDLDRDHRYWTLEELLHPERRWTEVANTTAAEQAATQSILDTIKSIPHHQNAEVEITALIQIAQEAARQALAERGVDPKGTHKLSGERTTIEEVLVKPPLYRWPLPAKNNGCIRDDCRSEHV
jgi:hypothetical protein